jgi:hypothetical protein
MGYSLDMPASALDMPASALEIWPNAIMPSSPQKPCSALGMIPALYKASRKSMPSDIICPNCEKAFPPKRAHSKFCCKPCSDEYFWRTHTIVEIPCQKERMCRTTPLTTVVMLCHQKLSTAPAVEASVL